MHRDIYKLLQNPPQDDHEAGDMKEPLVDRECEGNLCKRDFIPCLEAAGIRRMTFHALRHTFASLLFQQGASLPYLKEQMGHSSIQVTVDTYGHLIPGGNIDWVDRLDRKTSRGRSATQTQPGKKGIKSPPKEVSEVTDMPWVVGGPSRTRTCDQRIMSPPL